MRDAGPGYKLEGRMDLGWEEDGAGPWKWHARAGPQLQVVAAPFTWSKGAPPMPRNTQRWLQGERHVVPLCVQVLRGETPFLPVMPTAGSCAPSGHRVQCTAWPHPASPPTCPCTPAVPKAQLGPAPQTLLHSNLAMQPNLFCTLPGSCTPKPLPVPTSPGTRLGCKPSGMITLPWQPLEGRLGPHSGEREGVGGVNRVEMGGSGAVHGWGGQFVGAEWMASTHGVQVGDHRQHVGAGWGGQSSGQGRSCAQCGGGWRAGGLHGVHSPCQAGTDLLCGVLRTRSPGTGDTGTCSPSYAGLAGVQQLSPSTSPEEQQCRCLPCAEPAQARCGCWG